MTAAVRLRVGVVVALFVHQRAALKRVAFLEFRGLLGAGQAAHRACLAVLNGDDSASLSRIEPPLFL